MAKCAHIVLAIFLLIPLALAGQAAAAPSALASVAAAATPSVQGVNGTVTLEGTADLWGACCGVTEATGMVATITLGPGLVLVSGENPQKLPDVTIPPGKGGAATGRWVVRGPAVGEYDFSVKITSAASGEAEGTAIVKFINGPSISAAAIYPEKPIPNEAVSLSATITGPSGVKGATLAYCAGGGDWMTVPMTTQDGTAWAALVPGSPEGPVKYRVSATDMNDITLESSMGTFQVNDYPRIDAGVNMVMLVGTMISILGVVVIGAGFWFARYRYGSASARARGLHILGANEVTTSFDGTATDQAVSSHRNMLRTAVVAVLFILMIVLLAWGASAGQYKEMYNYMKPPWW